MRSRVSFVVALAACFLVNVLSTEWHIVPWKAFVLYFVGLLTQFILGTDKRPIIMPSDRKAAADVLEELHTNVRDSLASGPMAAEEVMKYIETCKEHCKKNAV